MRARQLHAMNPLSYGYGIYMVTDADLSKNLTFIAHLNFPGMATHDCYIGLVQLKNIVKVLPKHPYRVTVLILIIIF